MPSRGPRSGSIGRLHIAKSKCIVSKSEPWLRRTRKVQRSELAAAAVAGHAEAPQIQLVIERAAFVPGIALQLLEQSVQKSNLFLHTQA